MSDAKLRLHRTDDDAPIAAASAAPAHHAARAAQCDRASPKEVLPFPVGFGRHQALVAGKVAKSPTSSHDFEPRFTSDSAVLSADQIIANVESVLENMQSRLDHFKRDLDDAFKFPPQHQAPNDDDRPFAA